MNPDIYLASQSAGRKLLMEEAQIPFTTISQSADEHECDWNQSLQDVVLSIARYKMEYAVIPAATDNKHCIVITADTLVQSPQGNICGKPESIEHAKKMLQELQGSLLVASAFCARSFEWDGAQWKQVAAHEECVTSTMELYMTDAEIKDYISKIDVLKIAGALHVEGYGSQFIKSVEGSYTAIIGLPMFELRKALQQLGFVS